MTFIKILMGSQGSPLGQNDVANFMKRLILFVIFFSFVNHSVSAAPVEAMHSEAELVAEESWIQPAKPFWIAIRIKTEPQWHIYWMNPGDAGLATKIRWDLPEGFQVSAVKWPAPRIFLEKDILTYGYDGEIFLMAQVIPSRDISGQEIKLNARADWLVCDNACFPAKADLQLVLPVKNETPVPHETWAAALQKAREIWPADPQGKIRAEADKKKITLRFDGRALAGESVQNAYFFPAQAALIDYDEEQKFRPGEKEDRLEIPKSSLTKKWPENLKGILTLQAQSPEFKEKNFEVNVPLTKKSVWSK